VYSICTGHVYEEEPTTGSEGGERGRVGKGVAKEQKKQRPKFRSKQSQDLDDDTHKPRKNRIYLGGGNSGRGVENQQHYAERKSKTEKVAPTDIRRAVLKKPPTWSRGGVSVRKREH